ncbi:Crp/Fnr family transcriptional regulator [Erythrobacter sp. NFXS35]|uniref:Crp/Fnr family transcriptional regulator n=1 Tax=Erythrobacter sp. NFXS35 TaxID=2818436 RepID=UPI0032DFD365
MTEAPDMVDNDALELLTRRLVSNAALNSAERAAVSALMREVECFEAGACIVQHGAPCRRAWVLLEGFAYGQIGSRHSRRQIVGFYLAGDLLDLHGALTGLSSEAVIAATDCKIATLDAEALVSLIEAKPNLGRAFWIETLVEASIAREWIMNVGQRNARQRLAHLCCEMAWRSREAGLGDGRTFSMPITHEQLGDATGLTSLHVNHTLRKLEAQDLIVQDGHAIRIIDEARLRAEGDFEELYLCRSAPRSM